MAKKLFSLAVLALCGLLNTAAYAQATTYNLAQSSASYQELSGATTLNTGAEWVNSRYKVPVGFNFSHKGKTYDSLYIGTHGLTVFDKSGTYAFAAFLSMLDCRKDSAGNALSSISYQTSGSQGSRILKVEYKNCGIIMMPATDQVNFQVWLYEASGKIELRMGSSSISEGLSVPALLIGVIDNSGHNSPVNGLNGSPSAPQLNELNPETDPPHLTGIPAAGTIYSFTAN